MEHLNNLINEFLVKNFNYILRWEERVLSSYGEGILSVNEFHVIEAVIVEQHKQNNTMSEISKTLGVTVGSLTTSVKTLVAKGFITRQKGDTDKRTVWIMPTPLAIDANDYHEVFHHKMVGGVMDVLDNNELLTLTKALWSLADWFAMVEKENEYISIPTTQETKQKTK